MSAIYFRNGSVQRVNGSGMGAMNSIFSRVRGWVMTRRLACSMSRSGCAFWRLGFEYMGSASMAVPRCSMWTRIWWVRPVWRSHWMSEVCEASSVPRIL
mgnify:CR=1 FL=1